MVHATQVKQSTNPTSGDDLLKMSSALFRLRRHLLEQFGRMERDLLVKQGEKSEKFATREELERVVEKINVLRGELETVLVNVEDKLQRTAESVFSRNFDRNKSNTRSSDLDTDEINPAEEFFTGLNPFNLRTKYHELSLRLRSEEVDTFGYDPVFDRFVRPIFNFLYEKYWRIETYGIANIPRTGPALLVANHSGSLPYDATMLKMAVSKEHPTHRDVRFMVEDFLFHFPFLGSMMNRFGGVRASQENAERLLLNDLPVLVFPEGVKGLGKLYRDKYHLARFGRGGFVRLCLRTRAPLLPVAFIGPEEIHPMLLRETTLANLMGVPYIPITPTFPLLGPLGMIPLPSKWSIHIQPPIDFSNYGPGAEKDRVLVYKMAQRVKEQIQDTIVDKLKQRRSIWFG
jgi:1-acyl-sn-glycerol-3-phosphate acyltransferase